MTLKKRLISLCMAVVLIFSLSAVCASAAQEVATKQPTVSMSFDLNDRVKHEESVKLPDGSIAKITAEPMQRLLLNLSILAEHYLEYGRLPGQMDWQQWNIGLNWKKLVFTQKLNGHGGLR